MDFNQNENSELILQHSIVGLVREELIGSDYSYGRKEHLTKQFKKAPKTGIIFTPTVQGTELFYWAYGKPDKHDRDFLKTENEFELDENINIQRDYLSTKA